MLQSSAPPEAELRKLFQKHNGRIVDVARELRRPRKTVSDWCGDIGLRGTGQGGSQAYERAYPREIQTSLSDGCAVFFSDAHWWTEDKTPAHAALLKVLKKLKPAVVIANGDLLDGARISRHDPSGLNETPTLSDELHVCQVHMAEIARAVPQARRFYTTGNHDARFASYLVRNAPELDGLDGSRLEHHILGWEMCWSVKINDDVLVTHRVRGGQHAAWSSLLKAGINVYFGHLHSQKVYPYTDSRGTRYGVDMGCLADPQATAFAYTEASPLDWRSGFAIASFEGGKMLPPQLVTVRDDGSVWMQRNERVI